MSNHKSVPCSVVGCKNEGIYWIERPPWVRHANGGAPFSMDEPFYMCDEHHNTEDGLQEDENGNVNLLSPEGKVYTYECGVYACSEDCNVCNS